MACPACGATWPEGSLYCGACGASMTAGAVEPPPPAPSASPGVVGTLIPAKNVPALLAYYFGVFSLIPCLGLPLGIAAAICGVVGLRRAKSNPEARGGAHAWTGVILGGLAALGNGAAILWLASRR